MLSGLKPLTTAVALALMIGLVACGGEATSSSTNTAPTTPPSGGEAGIEEFGSEAGGSDKEAILGVFTGYLSAIADKDYGTACSHLSTTVQSSLQQLAAKGSRAAAGCSMILPTLLAPSAARVAREQADGRVTRARVQGDRAFVVFKAPGAKLYQLTMVREDGEWKAATVSASVLVPEL